MSAVLLGDEQRFSERGATTVNDETAKTHKYDIVGWLTYTLVMDHGLDPDHEDLYVFLTSLALLYSRAYAANEVETINSTFIRQQHRCFC